MKYQGIIFDLDGVICHTDGYHYKAWKSLADRLGVYFDEQINNRLRGVSRMESLEIILEKYDGTLTEEEKIKLAEEKNSSYKELLKKMSPKDLSPEVKHVLDKLREMGVKLSIGSSSKNTGFILQRIGLEGFFDGVSDGNNIMNSKPDPEVFIKAAELLGLKPSECLVIEDAVAGLQAAKNGGMDCAAIGDALNSDLADYKLTSFEDIISIVKE